MINPKHTIPRYVRLVALVDVTVPPGRVLLRELHADAWEVRLEVVAAQPARDEEGLTVGPGVWVRLAAPLVCILTTVSSVEPCHADRTNKDAKEATRTEIHMCACSLCSATAWKSGE